MLGAWVLASMTTVSLSDNGAGDLTTLGVVGAVGVLSALAVAEAAARQATIERWPLLRRLRIVGLGNRTLLLTMTVEAVVTGAVAALLGYAFAGLTLPTLVPYLQRVGVIGTNASPQASGGAGAVIVLVTVVAMSVIGSLRSTLRVTRTEPVAAALRTETVSSWRVRTRWVITTLIVLGTTWVTARTLAQPAGNTILLTSACWLALLCLLWRPGTAAMAPLLLRRPQRQADILLSHRWAASASTATASIGTILAVGITVMVASLYAVPDAAAREGLSRWLDGRHVAISTDTAAPDQPYAATLTQVTTRLHAASQPAPSRSTTAYEVTAQGAQELFSSVLLEGQLGHDSEGLVLPALAAGLQGLRVGDEVSATGTDARNTRTMRVIALVAVPPALGSFIVDSTSPAVAPATGVRIAVGAGLKPTDGWTVLTSQHWVDALPPGKALSNSGGEGALEIPLLIGAPLLLCLALIGSATFIAVHARGDDLNKLVKIGISRLVVRRIVAVATAAAILPAALASATILWMLTHYSLIPDSRLLGAHNAPVGPVSLYAMVAAAALATALATGQASVGRHLR